MDNFPPGYTEIFPEEDSHVSNLIKEKRYEVFKEEKGMLHGWYDCSVIEYEKYPDDKRRIVLYNRFNKSEMCLNCSKAANDGVVCAKCWIESTYPHEPITPEEIEELRAFEFYPHAKNCLKILGEDYEGLHYSKEDIERLIRLLIKYVA